MREPFVCFNGAALRGGAESPTARIVGVEYCPLQRGRAPGGRGIRPGNRAGSLTRPLQRGRAPGGRGMPPSGPKTPATTTLQRGRAPGGRGIAHKMLPGPKPGEASTGPRSGGARNLVAGDPPLALADRFNGAALRGGAESSRRTASPYPGGTASTGPRSGGARNIELTNSSGSGSTASTGPRSGGARNPSP